MSGPYKSDVKDKLNGDEVGFTTQKRNRLSSKV